MVLIVLLIGFSYTPHTLGGWSGSVGLRKSHCVLFLSRVNPILEFVVQILVLSESLILSELFFCNQLIGLFGIGDFILLFILFCPIQG